MRNIQKLVMLSTAAVLLLMLLFPPFHFVIKGKTTKRLGYSFIATPPQNPYTRVDVGLLLTQCLIVAGIGVICWVAFRKDETSEPLEDKPFVQKREKTGAPSPTQDLEETPVDNTSSIPPSHPPPQVTEQDFADFIGANADKYLPKFNKFSTGGSSITWHWAACLATFWWMLYRKLYLWTLIVFIWVAIMGELSKFLAPSWLVSSLVATLLSLFLFGVSGNYIYYKHAEKKILKLKSKVKFADSSGLSAALQREGGVNQWVRVVVIIMSVISLIGICAAILIPQIVAYKNRNANFAVISGEGCIEGDCKDGQGIYIFPNGPKYVGEFRDGEYHGRGTFTYPNGNKYVGEFKDDEPHGQGTLTWADGRRYVGQLKNGKPHGQGTFGFSDGRKLVGEFKNGKYHRQETATSPYARKYSSKSKSGQKQRQGGTLTLSNGSKYVSEFKNGKYHVTKYAGKPTDRESISRHQETSSSKLDDQENTYVVSVSGVVKDLESGLEWLASPDGNITWRRAKSWVDSLNIDGGGWRMPTIEDLQTLNQERRWRLRSTPIFQELVLYVWSGKTMGRKAACYYLRDTANLLWANRSTQAARAFAVRSRSDG